MRLPKAFRIEGEEVRIRRHGESVILEPVPTDWAWLDALCDALDADFAHAATEQPASQERQDLSALFS